MNIQTIERLNMTFMAGGKRQRLPLIFYSFLVISKYKHFDSTVQRTDDRWQKFHFCRLPFAVNVMLNLSNMWYFTSIIMIFTG